MITVILHFSYLQFNLVYVCVSVCHGKGDGEGTGEIFV